MLYDLLIAASEELAPANVKAHAANVACHKALLAPAVLAAEVALPGSDAASSTSVTASSASGASAGRKGRDGKGPKTTVLSEQPLASLRERRGSSADRCFQFLLRCHLRFPLPRLIYFTSCFGVANRGAGSALSRMLADRAKLPAAGAREAIVTAVKRDQVVLISGQTGCGKTTQVPQFILDDIVADTTVRKCKIVCTQPRRLAAIGVATRVADEMCEDIGRTVGYQVQLLLGGC